MANEDFDRKLTAIMSADVAGYSRLMGDDGSHLIIVVQHEQQIFSLNGGLMNKWMKTIVIFFLILLLNACAFDLSHVKQIPTQIESTQLSKSSFELLGDVNINLGTGYSRKLKKGTIWHYVGTISYGDIFKTDDQILTVEASNIYEAYIVISSSKIVGFYLPVEKSFSPVNDPEELKIREVNHVQ